MGRGQVGWEEDGKERKKKAAGVGGVREEHKDGAFKRFLFSSFVLCVGSAVKHIENEV